MFRKKIEVIPFREFMSPAAAQIRMETPRYTSIYGLLPGMSVESFFNMTPEVAGAYALVLGVGALAILSGLIGDKLADNGMEHITQIVEGITRVVLPVGAYGLMLYFLIKLMGGV